MIAFKDFFRRAFSEFVGKRKLIKCGDKIIVAVSGGIDSIVLLNLLSQFQQEWELEIAVAHFNHQLRGQESDDDEHFVIATAKKLGYECHVERAVTESVAEAQKLSVQEAARELRYAFFNRLRYSLGFDFIATAHNADDNAETILLNLFRGSGIHGMAGVPLMRKDLSIIRPLLFASRSQIVEYAQASGLQFREDSSNRDIEYKRNFIRHHIIPLIQENINPNLTTVLNRTSNLFNELEEYLNIISAEEIATVTTQTSSNHIVFDIPMLHTKPMFLQEYIIYQAIRKFTRLKIDFSTVKTILNISRAETGSTSSLTKDVFVSRNRNQLILSHKRVYKPFEYRIQIGQKYEFENFQFSSKIVEKAEFNNNPNTEYVDAELVSEQLILRTWNNGDWFIPLGLNNKKKISDFFVEQKIPVYEKHAIPLLEADGNIVWVCGHRLDERYKISDRTKIIAKLEYHPLSNLS